MKHLNYLFLIFIIFGIRSNFLMILASIEAENTSSSIISSCLNGHAFHYSTNLVNFENRLKKISSSSLSTNLYKIIYLIAPPFLIIHKDLTKLPTGVTCRSPFTIKLDLTNHMIRYFKDKT